MTATFKYNLDDFKVYSNNQAQNIVKSVKFKIVCEHMEQTREAFQTIEFADPDFNNFTEFKALSQAQIIAWVVQHLGQEEVSAIEFGLQSVIEYELSKVDTKPILENVKAPWL